MHLADCLILPIVLCLNNSKIYHFTNCELTCKKRILKPKTYFGRPWPTKSSRFMFVILYVTLGSSLYYQTGEHGKLTTSKIQFVSPFSPQVKKQRSDKITRGVTRKKEKCPRKICEYFVLKNNLKLLSSIYCEHTIKKLQILQE